MPVDYFHFAGVSYREPDGGLHADRWEWVPVVLTLSVGVAGSGVDGSIFSSQRVNCPHKVHPGKCVLPHWLIPTV